MELIFDVYGFQSNNLDELAKILAKLLNVTWVLRESSYIGEYYSLEINSSEDFQLRYNYSEEDEGWAELDFKEYLILLYISESPRFAEIEQILLGSVKINAVLLRRMKLTK